LKALQDAWSPTVRKVSIALSELFGMEIYVKPDPLQTVKPEEMIELLEIDSSTVISAVSKISGDFNGYLLLLISPEYANELLDIIFQHYFENDVIDLSSDIKADIVKEVANIVIGNLVSEICNVTSKKVSYTIPEVVYDFLSALIDVICIDLAMKRCDATMIKMRVTMRNEELPVRLLILMVEQGGQGVEACSCV